MIEQTLRILPDSPGIYQYVDKEGRLLYVGKAKSLKKRVKSYWRLTPTLTPAPNLSPRIVKMLNEASAIEYIVTKSEADALILENSLIKQLKPKYNILLRDDKTYPYIYIDEAEPFPRFEITRKVIKGKRVRYFGPFASGAGALLDALYESYKLVQKKSCLRGKAACLFYQIDRCAAPCEGRIDEQAYKKIVDEATFALQKRTPLIRKLEEKMYALASRERFEEAAKVRDNLQAIKSLEIHSSIDLAKRFDADIFAIDIEGDVGVVVKLFLRGGKIATSSYHFFRHTHLYDPNEAFVQVLLDFYHADAPPPVKEVLVANAFEGMEEVAKLLAQRFGKKIEIIHPKRGAKKRVIDLALKNAKELLRKKQTKSSLVIEKEVAALCALESIPYRIEVFDTSHMMGEANVGAMVVYEEGKWIRGEFRRYNLTQKDEYAQMKEMLGRRIESFHKNPPPDLWLIDGGEVHRKLALSLLKDAGVVMDVVAIAKEKLDAKAYRAKGAARDLLYTKTGILGLMPEDKRLQWFQRLRDKAHEEAIVFHRKQKQKNAMELKLLEKRGIGHATVKKLLAYFGTFDAIEKADFDEICKASDVKTAKALKRREIV